MWLLHFLPDSLIQFIVHTILVIGIVSFIVSFSAVNLLLRTFPSFAVHYRLIQMASVIILVAGVYFEGGYSTEMQWRERVREVELKLKESEKRSEELNDQLAKAAEGKIKYIRGRTEYITRYIETEVAKHDERFSKDGVCAIPQEFVKAHNDAASKPARSEK